MSPVEFRAQRRPHQGRFGRLSYMAWQAVLWCVACMFGLMLLLSLGVINFATLSLDSAAYLLPTLNQVISLLFFALYTYFAFVITIRRLHDLNLTGWWSLLSLLPLINILLFVYLLLASGTAQANRFGAVRVTPFWEKLVAWLCIAFMLLVFMSFASVVSHFSLDANFSQPQQIIEKTAEFF
ncbi:DUF805 domain-containing protein [uncultured Acinetobacter sp.]|uniref:DUF805 domain-containing protein n=1 Tax=uncultured Acinetobacter sp. TaxID=165433 RepID=UPI00261695BC|nr:DUF805 domain-containing protein [uncultured Acinetobacter sp.]